MDRKVLQVFLKEDAEAPRVLVEFLKDFPSTMADVIEQTSNFSPLDSCAHLSIYAMMLHSETQDEALASSIRNQLITVVSPINGLTLEETLIHKVLEQQHIPLDRMMVEARLNFFLCLSIAKSNPTGLLCAYELYRRYKLTHPCYPVDDLEKHLNLQLEHYLQNAPKPETCQCEAPASAPH